MKTQIVFKLEKNPDGFKTVFAQNCEISIEKRSGPLFLNYEHRIERIVGRYENLRQEGEVILADVELFEKLQPIEERIEYAIEGTVVNKNDKDEANIIKVFGVGALMNNKF